MSNGDTTVIYDASDSDYSGGFGYQCELSQAAELRNGGRFLLTFTRANNHNTFIIDMHDKTYIYNTQMDRGDCSPSWAPDGSYVLNTARTSSRPVVKANFSAGGPSVSDSTHFVGVEDQCQGYQYYIHGERVSNDGEWVAMGGWCKQGPKSNGHREIYIWKIGEPEANAVRMTFDTDEDKSPSLHVGGVVCPDSDGDGYTTCEGDCDDGNTSVHPGASEACNGNDDDCDGSVPSNENDSDSDGYRRCQGDCDDGDASVHPDATEACNGTDDDCDGNTDEGCDCMDGEQQPCGTDEGECVAGTQTCAGGSWGSCEGEVGPEQEACNGLDDDCDGNVPSNETDSDSDGYRSCEGDCDDGDASVHPDASEACNGIDDNCDGDTDEGCECQDGEQQSCGTDEGECVAGTQTCTGGSWGNCEGEVGPVAEACNGTDDDCDGDVPAEESDSDGDGHRVCEGDCNDSDAAIHPGADEVCNGADDDCDGTTDDGCPCVDGEQQPCGTDEGECVAGTQTCAGGSWGDCEGEVGPVAEACNGMDDDCDGSVPPDEADADSDGHRTCAGDCDDGDAAVYPGAEEVCNQKDDNCDGVEDEGCPCSPGDERPCGPDEGACEPGSQQCVDGSWSDCEGGVGPVDEVCGDDLDNDCDGTTDEDCASTNGDEIVIEGSCACGASASFPGGLVFVSFLLVMFLALRRR
jgi:hypothetical protein